MGKAKAASLNNCDVGKRLILSAIDIDNILTDLLKLEIKNIRKKLLTKELDTTDMAKLILLVKYIIFALTLTDDRIRKGMEVYNISEKTEVT